jgi:hypothetical protein
MLGRLINRLLNRVGYDGPHRNMPRGYASYGPEGAKSSETDGDNAGRN